MKSEKFGNFYLAKKGRLVGDYEVKLIKYNFCVCGFFWRLIRSQGYHALVLDGFSDQEKGVFGDYVQHSDERSHGQQISGYMRRVPMVNSSYDKRSA